MTNDPQAQKRPRVFKRPAIEPPPVVDTNAGKYAEVSLITYIKTTDLITRTSIGYPTLIGYCTENPLEALRIAFPNYHVTRFDKYEFFGDDDFEPTTPVLGLGITGIEPVFGIEGKIEKLLELSEALRVKRDRPISREDIQRILAHLGGEEPSDWLMRLNYHRIKHDEKQIIEVIGQFAK